MQHATKHTWVHIINYILSGAVSETFELPYMLTLTGWPVMSCWHRLLHVNVPTGLGSAADVEDIKSQVLFRGEGNRI